MAIKSIFYTDIDRVWVAGVSGASGCNIKNEGSNENGNNNNIFSLFLVHKATEQVSDLLIYKNDTIYINYYPLEILAKNNSEIAKRLNDDSCIKTSCWRQYVGIWKIENDSLFLIGLKDCCDHNPIYLKKIFSKKQIQKRKVFANWYSAYIETGFGKRLQFSQEKWEYIYEKKMKLMIKNGKVESIKIENTNS